MDEVSVNLLRAGVFLFAHPGLEPVLLYVRLVQLDELLVPLRLVY